MTHHPQSRFDSSRRTCVSSRSHLLYKIFADMFYLSIALRDSASFSPFAQRTQQMIREQLGQAEDRTQLPDEYIELEKRVDALKLVHQKLLQVT